MTTILVGKRDPLSVDHPARNESKFGVFLPPTVPLFARVMEGQKEAEMRQIYSHFQLDDPQTMQNL